MCACVRACVRACVCVCVCVCVRLIAIARIIPVSITIHGVKLITDEVKY